MALKWGKRGKEVIGSGALAVEHQKPERISNKLEHVLAAEVKQQPLKQRVKTRARRVVAHKRFKQSVMVLGVVVLLFVYFVRNNEQPPRVSTATDVCSADKRTYGDIASAIKRSDTQRANTIVENILLDPRYKIDVNCRTAVVEYKLLISDTKAADAELQQLKTIAGSDTSLNEAYAVIGLRTVKDIEDHVGKWKKLSEQAKGNVLLSNPVK